MGYTTAPPFNVDKNGNLTGINIWLWKRVAKDLNLNYELVPMGFSEMLDSLYTGGIDLSINPGHFRQGRDGIWDAIWSSAVAPAAVGYGDKAPKNRSGKLAALGLMFGGLL